MLNPASLLLDELTSPEVAGLIAEGYKTVIVPLGATEQHGPALPLLVDNAHARETCLRAAKRLGRTLVGPVMTLGVSPEHTAFAGTISLSEATAKGILHDIAESHARSGFQLVYFWIGHGGNFGVLQQVLTELDGRWPGCRVAGLRDIAGYVRETWDQLPVREGVSPEVSGSHAGEFETSMMLAMHPGLVRMAAAERGSPEALETVFEKMMTEGIGSVSPNGVLGDQRAGDAERGDRYLDGLAQWLVRDIEKLRNKV